jgi:sarcosine oxidase gamma subunit
VAGEIFHLYVLRTFALSIWDHVTDAALEFK